MVRVSDSRVVPAECSVELNVRSLDPFFDSRVTTSRVTGEEYTTLRLPMVVMAEYEDGDVVHVTPHETDGSVRTVEDRSDRLEESIIAGPPERPRP